MATPVTSVATECALRTFLLSRGYTLSAPHAYNGATGPDVIAEKNGIKTVIEVIGYKSSGSARSRDFYEAFFRCISRIKLTPDIVALACPIHFSLGIDDRTTVYGQSWFRLGNAFPELELWFVYPCGKKLDYAAWNYWAENYSRPRRHDELIPAFRCARARYIKL
jgi:hypothetical protein